MTFYHCSTRPGVKTLKPHISKIFGGEKVIYMTSLLPMALMYGINHFEYTYGYHWIDGRPAGIYYSEYFPNALEELYGGERGYLYTCEEGDFLTTEKPNEYISKRPVKTLTETVIEDLYQALIEMEAEGTLEIIRYEDATDKMLSWIRKAETDTILENHLLEEESDFAVYMKEKYPESWQDAIQQ